MPAQAIFICINTLVKRTLVTALHDGISRRGRIAFSNGVGIVNTMHNTYTFTPNV